MGFSADGSDLFRDSRNLLTEEKRVYLWWSLCTLYLLARQERVTIATQVLVVVFVGRLSSANLINSLVC